MCAELQVSRGTLRQALHILRGKGLLLTDPGQGHRLLGLEPEIKSRSKPLTVRFLSPEPLELRRAFFSLMLDKLHETADARGWKIRRDHGPRYFGEKSGARLEQLVDGAGDDCWILVHANRQVQEWFWRRRITTIVSGHPYSGVELPSLDVDHRASGHHAGGVLMRNGHRWVAMVVSSNPLPGLREGESGFKDAFGHPPRADHRITRVVHRGTETDLVKSLQRLFGPKDHPTAILVETPHQYITVLSTLARMRKVVPEDVSLISRLDDPFMQHFEPEPARYRVDPVLFARALATMVSHLAEGEALQPRVREIVPEFITGRSVAPQSQESVQSRSGER